MRKTAKTGFTAAVTTLALMGTLLAGGLAAAQAPAAPAKSAMPVQPAQAKSGYRAEFLVLLDDVQKKVLTLAEAVPADKYSWRPAPGVRSVGEVYMHLAGANFYFPTLWGVKPPADVDVRNLEKSSGDKAKVAAALQQSFAHVRQVVESTSDADLEKSVSLFGHPGTVRAAMTVMGNHTHEHLGQSIAYARSNGIVPPWSQADAKGSR
jgi:uncharacterized damage-inducible protein DinB